MKVNLCGQADWEEITNTSMMHLLCTQLATTQQEKSVLLAPLAQRCDVQNLKKHLSIVLARLSQGAKLLSGAGAELLLT